jgi:hypothetical protein
MDFAGVTYGEQRKFRVYVRGVHDSGYCIGQEAGEIPIVPEGTQGTAIAIGPREACAIARLRSINYRKRPMSVGVGKSTHRGFATPPSLEMIQPGKFRMLWPVMSGEHSISVWCGRERLVVGMAERDKPRMVIKANPDLGVPSDIVEVAADSENWVLIGPMTVMIASDYVTSDTLMGVLEVWLEYAYDGSPNAVWFDAVSTT